MDDAGGVADGLAMEVEAGGYAAAACMDHGEDDDDCQRWKVAGVGAVDTDVVVDAIAKGGDGGVGIVATIGGEIKKYKR